VKDNVVVYISDGVAWKLREKHGVTETEVFQCFGNNTAKYAEDTREEHHTHPPTLWFIADTNAGRRLKVVFRRYSKAEYVLKTAFPPSEEQEALWQRYVQRG
jgi:hypothetical protein